MFDPINSAVWIGLVPNIGNEMLAISAGIRDEFGNVSLLRFGFSLVAHVEIRKPSFSAVTGPVLILALD